MKKNITLILAVFFASLTSNSNAQTAADSAYVTFQVDMSTVSSTFITPEVNGTFNSWCGACWTMSDPDGDNIWQATGRILKSTPYEFKFSADSWSIQESLFSGLPCVISQWGYTNRTLNVTGDTTLPVVCWESCGPCSSGPSSYNVTFQVDMNYVTDPFSTPEVNGTFNGWCGNCFSMSDANGDNVWDFTTQIGIGSYEYKFSADNWNIAENLDSTLSCVTTVTDSTGTFVNRTLVVSNADIVLPIVYWNGCSTAPVSGCTDSLALNFNPIAVIEDGSCNYSSYTITTSGLAFVPDTIICDVGDTIFFVNGPSHNAVEVSETTFLSGGTSALSGGFNFGFGASGYFIPSLPTTHYYVCQPHVWAGMVGVIIVNPPPAALALQGIMDFTVPSAGSDGKAIHLIATDNIADLSVYGIGVANNGGGTDGQEYTFDPISVNTGDDILVVRSVSAMTAYFDSCYSEFEYVLLGNSDISQNGDDAVELFYYGNVIETFGDINVDGTGTPWEYMDSWAYKDATGSVGFSGGNWIFGGVNCTDNSTTTYT
ncbi:plastocyanin/azurin family copper-binding protein, partial [Bacteroidota bacterium]|nr:plastocyanin/azurin family copper-binding protein [Bacteroidota bacterium]